MQSKARLLGLHNCGLERKCKLLYPGKGAYKRDYLLLFNYKPPPLPPILVAKPNQHNGGA